MDLQKNSNNTAGELLKQKRLEKGLDFKTIEKELKIKEKYLAMLEANRFQGFESQVQSKGFLKNYARFLGLNHEMVLALYRRDFENKDMKRKIEFKEETEPEVEVKESLIVKKLKNTTITKKTLQLSSVVIILIFISLLVFTTVRKSFSKPSLEIYYPFEISAPYDGKITYEQNEIVLKGRVDKGSSITVNSVPLNLSTNYEFETSALPLQNNETDIVLKTENTLGATSEIKLKLTKPEIIITKLDTLIQNYANIDYLGIRVDNILVHEGPVYNGSEPLNFIAERVIEIETQQFEDIELFINGKEYILDKPVTIFESTGSDIVKI